MALTTLFVKHQQGTHDLSVWLEKTLHILEAKDGGCHNPAQCDVQCQLHGLGQPLPYPGGMDAKE